MPALRLYKEDRRSADGSRGRVGVDRRKGLATVDANMRGSPEKGLKGGKAFRSDALGMIIANQGKPATRGRRRGAGRPLLHNDEWRAENSSGD